MISSPIFVLGSSGFGGSSFVAHCIKEGLETYGFSRSSPPDEQFLPYKWNKNQSKFTFYNPMCGHKIKDHKPVLIEMSSEFNMQNEISAVLCF